MRLTSSSVRKALRKATAGETIPDAARRLGIVEPWPDAPARPVGPPEVEKRPQNIKDFAGFWSTSIGRVDRHALSCKSCWKPRNSHAFAVTVGGLRDHKLERYRLCPLGQKLYAQETAARVAYLKAGGKLPVY